mgnify:CR=1 FL=1|tara:strand:+ start:7540 stop:7950 length:411 start_codon:yes stop_codon:yes gene_type:complete
MNDPEKLIQKLKMLPHPEGGYFAESYRDKNNDVSLIYYLLKKNQRSHWHRLTKNEILHFYLGDPMSVFISPDGKESNSLVLGNNISNDQNMHIIIKAGSWFSMKSTGKYTLIGCTVAPGFNYSDFELAPENWEPGR